MVSQKFEDRDGLIAALDAAATDTSLSDHDRSESILSLYILAIELALDNGDESEIAAWTWGLGNCWGETASEVSEVMQNIDGDFKETLLEQFMALVQARFGIDLFVEGDYRSEDEGVDWDAVVSSIVSAEM